MSVVVPLHGLTRAPARAGAVALAVALAVVLCACGGHDEGKTSRGGTCPPKTPSGVVPPGLREPCSDESHRDLLGPDAPMTEGGEGHEPVPGMDVIRPRKGLFGDGR